jgi:hypothetical protein
MLSSSPSSFDTAMYVPRFECSRSFIATKITVNLMILFLVSVLLTS